MNGLQWAYTDHPMTNSSGRQIMMNNPNMSDSDFGSPSSSSLGSPQASLGYTMINGNSNRRREQGGMGSDQVQSYEYMTQPHPGALSYPSYTNSYNYTPPSSQPPHEIPRRGMNNKSKPMKSPSGGKPAAMSQVMMNDARSKNKSSTTDHFLSQFQEQMSQVKLAMDAVQNELRHHSSPSPPPPIGRNPPSIGLGGGKPRAAAAMGMGVGMGGNKRGPGRPKGNGPPTSQGGGSIRYQSQISALNGLKLKIKKSPGQAGKRKGSKPKARRKRRKGEDEDDFDDEISDDDGKGYSKRPPASHKSTKFSPATGNSSSNQYASSSATNNESPNSGWGDTLPENVLEKILSYAVKYEEGCIPVLIRASKVSRLWRKTASRPELWNSVDLSSGVKDKFKIERNLIYFLEHRFPKVKHLNLGGWSTALTNASIEVLIRICTDLESLGLHGCQKLTAQHIRSITESCNCLKKLDLSAISTTYNTKTAVSPTAMTEAAETMSSRLIHLSLASNCLANCSQIVAALADHCPNLQFLDLSNVTSPRRDSISLNLEHLQQGCQKLKILRLTNSDFALNETPLKEQVSSPGFPDLEELSIAVDPKKCQGMDQQDLERILKHANKLRLLDVRGCSRIGDSGLVRISAWDLEHLYLSGCYATKSSNDGLELVARKWRHSFKEIDFSWTPGEETINSAIKALSEMDEDDVPPLKVLDLCGSSVSFESVKVALKTCIHLERLNLTSCRALPRGIKRNYQMADEVCNLREQVLSGKFDDHEDD